MTRATRAFAFSNSCLVVGTRGRRAAGILVKVSSRTIGLAGHVESYGRHGSDVVNETRIRTRRRWRPRGVRWPLLLLMMVIVIISSSIATRLNLLRLVRMRGRGWRALIADRGGRDENAPTAYLVTLRITPTATWLEKTSPRRCTVSRWCQRRRRTWPLRCTIERYFHLDEFTILKQMNPM